VTFSWIFENLACGIHSFNGLTGGVQDLKLAFLYVSFRTYQWKNVCFFL